MLAILDDLKADGTGIIELCAGTTHTGRQFHAFVQMTPDQYQRYQDDLATGKPMDIGSYGDVIHTGWGLEPDADTRARILCDHTDQIKIMEEIGTQLKAMKSIIRKNCRGETG